jgi:N-methylhydantoinase A
VLIDGARVDAAIVARSDLGPGSELAGPAIVEQEDATTVLAPDEAATVDPAGNLVIRWTG